MCSASIYLLTCKSWDVNSLLKNSYKNHKFHLNVLYKTKILDFCLLVCAHEFCYFHMNFSKMTLHLNRTEKLRSGNFTLQFKNRSSYFSIGLTELFLLLCLWGFTLPRRTQSRAVQKIPGKSTHSVLKYKICIQSLEPNKEYMLRG